MEHIPTDIVMVYTIMLNLHVLMHQYVLHLQQGIEQCQYILIMTLNTMKYDHSRMRTKNNTRKNVAHTSTKYTEHKIIHSDISLMNE